MKTWKKKVAALAFLLGALPAMPALAQHKLRLSVLPFSESLAAVAADKQGYFKDEGLQIEMSRVNSGALALPLLVSGSIDIAFSNTIATLQALEQGLDGVILAPGAVSRSQTPDATTSLLVRADSPIKSPKDLKGKRVAINVINSSAWMYMMAVLDKYDVDPTSVRFVEIPFPQMNTPLLNSQIDAAGQVDPFTTVALKSGQVRAIAYPYVEAQPNADITQYIALRSWISGNKEIAQKFVRAIRKGAEFVNNPANAQAVRQMNMEFTNLKPELKDDVQLPRLGESVSPEQLNITMKMMLKYGLLKKSVDLSKHIYQQ